MEKISIRLFGKPEIRLGGDVISLSLKRSEALIYYLAVEKRASRDGLVGLIWAEQASDVAKKNLRNSLYRIKKDLGVDFFDSPNKNLVEQSKNVCWEVDVHASESVFLSHYEGACLEGFSLKGAPGFEGWRLDLEQSLNQRYKQLVLKYFEKWVEEDWDMALRGASVLQKIDPFDEVATRLLMQAYKRKNMYKQIVETYGALKLLLEEEMGIKPDAETRTLYYSLIQARTKENVRSEIFGREQELEKLTKRIQNYRTSNETYGCFLEGEAGVGKTKLLHTVVEGFKEEVQIIWYNCYMVEENFAYKAWNDVLGKLVDTMKTSGFDVSEAVTQVLGKVFPSVLNVDEVPLVENMETIRSDYLERMVCRLIGDFTKRQKLILIFDDLQWMDEWSLKLLQSVLLHVEGVLVIGSMRKTQLEKLEHFIVPLYKYDTVEKIPVDRFSKAQTIAFLVENLGLKQEGKALDAIYEATLGNAFFIVEYAGYYLRNDKAALSRLKNLMDARLLEVGKEAQKVLGILSMFFDAVEHNLLEKLYSQSADELHEVLEELRLKDFIEEVPSEDVLKWRFTHHMLRNHVYSKTSFAIRKVLHHKIAELLENKISGTQKDVLIFQKLMYHYEEGKNISKRLEYTIKYLKTYFDFSHELYPEVQQGYEVQLDFSPEYYFELLDKLFEASESEVTTSVQLAYLHMKARYHIRGGEYEEGMQALLHLIDACEVAGDDEINFKAHVQYVYYYIQTEQPEKMREKLERMTQMVKNTKQEAMLMRLMGIERLISGEYVKARMLFRASIEAFESLAKPKLYALNIAAAYNYISETYLREGHLETALEYAAKAIMYCKKYNIIRGRSIFNTNAGIIAYTMDDSARAKVYLEEALKCYDVVDSPWKKSEAEAYLGMICMREGQTQSGMSLLYSAKEHAERMGTPKTIGLVNRLIEEAEAMETSSK